MAGFFGLFNYEKEGPGISKNAPRKKTFIVFFETFFRNFWKFIPINLVYSLISVPLVTNGLANAGITNVTRNTARDKHSFGLSDFFETIKKNFKQSLIVGIINTIAYIVLFFDLWFFFNSEGIMGIIGLGISLSIFVIFVMMGFYLWTLMITFNFTIKQLYKNSFKFVFINFKFNLLCLFVNILIFAFNIAVLWLLQSYFFIVLLIELFVFLAIYPCFNALLVQYCVFPSIKKYIIDPYYEQHPDEDIEKRKNLGLEVEEKTVEEEPVFSEEIIENTESEEESDVIFED